MDLLLYSEVEEKVPQGAVQELVTRLLNQYFNDKEVNIASLLGERERPMLVRGTAEVLSLLINQLHNVAGNKEGTEHDTGIAKQDLHLATEGQGRHPDAGGDETGHGGTTGGENSGSSSESLRGEAQGT